VFKPLTRLNDREVNTLSVLLGKKNQLDKKLVFYIVY